MQLEECLAKASREGGSGLCNATLCTSQLSCETREEVVLRLLGSEDRYGRQYAECICTKEDNILSVWTCALTINLLSNLLNVVDRIAYASVLSHALVGEVDLAVSINCNILEKSITLDSIVDVGLVLLAQVDNLCIATAFEIEHTFIVPTMLVVTNQETLRVSGKSGLTCARQTEEDSSVLTFHIGISGAVHRSDALQRQVVVLH